MTELISALEAVDVRFPTSLSLDGSDAMNPEPDYSAAYVTIRTSAGDGGYGLAFTVGRGNDVQVAAVRALVPLVAGMPVDDALSDLGGFSRRLTGDSQLRWLGPDKGAIHMAAAAIVNAVWDLRARREGKPVWRLLAEMPPADLVDLIDFRYLKEALTRDEALDILRRAEPGRAARQAELLASGYPAYTTTPGWLGYSPEKLAALAAEAVKDGFTQIKLKVGADLDEDVRRLRLARGAGGPRARSAARTGGSRSTPTRRGASSRPSRGCGRWRSSTRTGSRSRPRPTTCSATPRSAGRWRRSRWPPGCTRTTR